MQRKEISQGAITLAQLSQVNNGYEKTFDPAYTVSARDKERHREEHLVPWWL